MKKDYNRDIMSDMPVDSSFTPPVKTVKTTAKTTTKPKINAIGQKRTNSKKSTTNKAVKTSDKKLRTKLNAASTELSDLEKLNEENIKTYRFKLKRNRVFIAILSILLIISVVSIVTFITISKLKTNCNLYIHGDVDAVFIVDGMEMDEFRAPSNLQGNRVFKFDVEIKINNDAYYQIKFIPKTYQKGVLMNNTLIYEHNRELFYDGGDGYYYSIEKIRGNQTISLCGGVILDYDYEQSLNVDNFRLDLHVYFEKV